MAQSKKIKHTLSILYISPEANPFAPNGDLAEKVEKLALGIAKRPENHFVAVLIPGYEKYLKTYQGLLNFMYTFKLPTPYDGLDCNVYQIYRNGVTYFLLNIPTFFNRASMYGYPDDAYRFAAFNLAVDQFVKDQQKLRVRYDIVHVFDWESGFLPYILRNEYPWMRVVYTVNDPEYQCSMDYGRLWDLTRFDFSLYLSGVAKQNDALNFLKTGLTLADIVTVSNKQKAGILRNYLDSYQNLGYIFDFKKDRFRPLDNLMDIRGYDDLYNELADENNVRYTLKKD